MGLIASFAPVRSAAHGARPAAPRATEHVLLAIWPETDRSVAPAAFPAWRTSATDTVTHFARSVLGYPAPVVTARVRVAGGKPGERNFYVAPTASAHRILVTAKRVIDRTHWSITYLWGFGKHDHNASVAIQPHHAEVAFAFWGPSRSASLALIYGSHSLHRTAQKRAQWRVSFAFPINVGGAVMVLFRNAAGAVYTGWATPVGSGRFAAG